MVNHNSNNPIERMSPGLLLAIGLVLTVSIILAIKFMVRDDEPPASAPAAAGADKLFNEGEKLTPPGYNPTSRSETTSGDSLDMFTKTNQGYAEEDSTAAVPAAEPAIKRSAPAKPSAAKPRAAAGTVIPRMTPKTFGTAAGQQPAQKGAAPPDIQGLIKQAKEKSGVK